MVVVEFGKRSDCLASLPRKGLPVLSCEKLPTKMSSKMSGGIRAVPYINMNSKQKAYFRYSSRYVKDPFNDVTCIDKSGYKGREVGMSPSEPF